MTLKACIVCGRSGPWGRGSRCPAHPASQGHDTRGSREYALVRAAVLERDGYRCTLCNAELERVPGDGGEPAEVDHVRARAHGGSHEPENLRATCRRCNRTRTRPRRGPVRRAGKLT